MFEILDIGASGLQAQRTRLDTIAQNIANVNTTRGPNGEKTPFRRRLVQFAQGQSADDNGGAGVHVASIDQDPVAVYQEMGPAIIPMPMSRDMCRFRMSTPRWNL